MEVNLESVRIQINERRGAGAVHIGDPYTCRIESCVFEGQGTHDETLAEETMPKVWPAFDFVVADAAQLSHVAAQQIAQKHQFTP
ncbi:hypothetical protein D3C84_1038200 [compost metagenome]